MKKCSPLDFFFWRTLWSIPVGYRSTILKTSVVLIELKLKRSYEPVDSFATNTPPPRIHSGAPRPEFIHLDSSYCNCVIRAITNIAVGPAPPSTHSGRYNRHYKRQTFSPLVSLNEVFLLSSLDHHFGST